MPFGFVLHFAAIAAIIRDSGRIELVDLFAGLYVACKKRLSPYWKKVRGFDTVARRDPIVNSFSSEYRKGTLLSPVHREQIERRGAKTVFSRDLTRVLISARRIAAAAQPPRKKPLVTPEDILLSLAGFAGSDIGKILIESGLDLRKLKKALSKVRRNPP